MEFTGQLDERTQEINRLLQDFLPPAQGPQETVIAAMRYSVEAGGKRLRPMLMQETHRLFHGHSSSLGAFMAAVELIHTYSLVHDDLPAMDNDRYRRGKPTTWAVYGDAFGVLAGDGLLNYAFEIMTDAVVQFPEDPNPAHAMQILARKAGIGGMIGGQAVDVETEGKHTDLKTLEFIHGAKTCALIEASMLAGAVLAGASPAQQALVEESAHALGMAFQIQDDILDVVGNEETLGKPVGSDAKNEKQTYVTLLGLEASREMVRTQTQTAMDAIRRTGLENRFLLQLMEYLISREK